MAFDFPASPTEGQEYAPAGGPTYVYKSPRWMAKSTAPTAETRNRIVNGNMVISQENGNTAGTGNTYYPVDQHFTPFSSTGTFSVQQVASVTPNGSRNRIRFTVNTANAAPAAGNIAGIRQLIEGSRVADFMWGTASARQIIVRFGLKGPAGTYSYALRNQLQNRSYVANFTISAGQANTDTTQTFIIPGDTTGTWLTDTGIGLFTEVGILIGTTYQGAAGWQAGVFMGTSANSNGMATAGNIFELFDVGLYLDPLASGVAPAWTMPDEAQELAACQRYWARTTSYFSSSVTSAVAYNAHALFPQPMRITPAFSGTNNEAVAFPATVGGLVSYGTGVRDSRTASATAAGVFSTAIVLNARM